VSVWIAFLSLAGMVAGFCWNLARRAHADRKRQLHRLELELRLTDALETFHREVFRLKHYPVLRPKVPETAAAGLIPSTKVSSLRYIKGRQHED
jgi:hypothetical protein